VQLIFLGTSAGVPTRRRNVASLALRLPERAEVWLFDCGEATQHQVQRSDVRISQIRRIFITHLHGDHLYGLLGLLASRGLAGDAERIDLYGPPGLDEYLRAGLRYSHARLNFPVEVRTVEAGVIVEHGDFAVQAAPLAHRVPTFGYRIRERDRPGALDAERAVALGVPFGPLFGRLKRGERVRLADGRVVDGAALLGSPEPGRGVAYCTDTAYCREAVELAADADLLVHEATFAQRDAELARATGHATAAEAARVAREAGARRLILTHVSARYAPGAEIGPEALLAEARAVFPATELAEDFLTVEVPRRSG
jgi:ribonuclease Z